MQKKYRTILILMAFVIARPSMGMHLENYKTIKTVVNDTDYTLSFALRPVTERGPLGQVYRPTPSTTTELSLIKVSPHEILDVDIPLLQSHSGEWPTLITRFVGGNPKEPIELAGKDIPNEAQLMVESFEVKAMPLGVKEKIK